MPDELLSGIVERAASAESVYCSLVAIDPAVLFLSFGPERAPIVTAEGDGSP